MSQDLRIVVWVRGFISVGYFNQESGIVTLRQASTVRRWGTSKGLGELALRGPLGNTILDFEGTNQGSWLSVVKTIKCNPDAWDGRLPDQVNP